MIDFINLVREFYALETVNLIFSSFASREKTNSMIQGYVSFVESCEMDCGKSVYYHYGIVTSRAKEKLLYDFIEYRERFMSYADAMMRDYIVIASACESRLARRMAEKYCPSIPDTKWRQDCAKEILQFNKDDLISMLKWIFDPELNSWRDSFGGRAWYNAVMALEIEDSVTFIDHCVDLEHNGGFLFNKSSYKMFFISNDDELASYLDFKRYARIDQIMMDYLVNPSQELARILIRANNLGIIEYPHIGNANNKIGELYNYAPIEFGNAGLIELTDTYSSQEYEYDEMIEGVVLR